VDAMVNFSRFNFAYAHDTNDLSPSTRRRSFRSLASRPRDGCSVALGSRKHASTGSVVGCVALGRIRRRRIASRRAWSRDLLAMLFPRATGSVSRSAPSSSTAASGRRTAAPRGALAPRAHRRAEARTPQVDLRDRGPRACHPARSVPRSRSTRGVRAEVGARRSIHSESEGYTPAARRGRDRVPCSAATARRNTAGSSTIKELPAGLELVAVAREDRAPRAVRRRRSSALGPPRTRYWPPITSWPSRSADAGRHPHDPRARSRRVRSPLRSGVAPRTYPLLVEPHLPSSRVPLTHSAQPISAARRLLQLLAFQSIRRRPLHCGLAKPSQSLLK